jgi:RNA polymerase sigma factor (sigma-70 family)
MDERSNLIPELHEGRRRFLALVADLRPDLHRYCARMTGSVAEGEDIVQDTLSRAYFLLPEMLEFPVLRPWLFKIAHHRALDHLRRYDQRMSDTLDPFTDTTIDPAPEIDDALEQDEAVRSAIYRFMELPPGQRACVILKDVLGHSLDEISELLRLSLPAVKSLLHRGRAALRRLQSVSPVPVKPDVASSAISRYVGLFNARAWDGVRALLAKDVQLDLVTVAQRSGDAEVGNYLSNYDRLHDWFLAPAWLEGREVIAVSRDSQAERPGYFIELKFVDGKVAAIHDFRYVPYIAKEAVLELIAPSPEKA